MLKDEIEKKITKKIPIKRMRVKIDIKQ